MGEAGAFPADTGWLRIEVPATFTGGGAFSGWGYLEDGKVRATVVQSDVTGRWTAQVKVNGEDGPKPLTIPAQGSEDEAKRYAELLMGKT